MDLGRLRSIVGQLIEELGEDAPVAVFLFTAACIEGYTDSATVARILNQFQHFHGEPPLQDYLMDELEKLCEEMASDGDDASGLSELRPGQ